MPMNPRLLRPLASAAIPVAEARDSSDNVIAPADYVDANGKKWRAHIFTASGTLNFTKGGKVEYLVVGGGGGGGAVQSNAQNAAGGGGAGGFLSNEGGPLLTVLPGVKTVTVGAGGAGGASGANPGVNGEASAFDAISASGGGGGGGSLNGNAASGGSGGGGGAATGTEGSGAAGQGNAGAAPLSVSTFRAGGGGGGAGGAAPTPAGTTSASYTQLPNGGVGRLSNLPGAPTYYAGGGGGGVAFGTVPSSGGLGGGGNGGVNEDIGTASTAGQPNTGGGGGGSGRSQTSVTIGGSAGGSGIVIVRYPRIEATDFDDPDVVSYLNAVQTADGAALEPAVRTAIADFIVGCKADGIWDAIQASCILAGARTLAGALVPLVGTAPTNNNFVGGDYDREAGLVGDGSTKYLDSNRANDDDPQDDKHISVYRSVAATNDAGLIGSNGTTTGHSHIYTGFGNFIFRMNAATSATQSLSVNTGAAFLGASRDAAASFGYRIGGTGYTATVTSQTPNGNNIRVFETGGKTDARIAFYSVGESLDLSALDTRVSALMTAIGAAI
jgi:hypothetical protein